VDEKDMHDLLLSVKPDGAVHDATACRWCSPATATEHNERTGGGVLDVSITQEDIDKAVAAAVGPLQTELDALRQFKAEVESTDAVNAARAEAQAEIEAIKAQIDELQTKLDAATIEATEAKTKYDEVVAWLDEEATKAEQEAQVAALREERVEAVKALKVFPDEYVVENADRYARMDAELFEANLADWKAIKATKAPEGEEEEELPSTTTFVATRDDDGKPKASAMREVMSLRNAGIDLRRIRG
jgi:chromosome segregation ATPase